MSVDLRLPVLQFTEKVPVGQVVVTVVVSWTRGTF